MSSKHGATWWSGRFLRSLERLGMTTRLKRGHAYFEEGRVLDLEVEAGEVRSLVKDDVEYECRIHFEPFSNMDWSESLERLALSDLTAAALLTTGRMPPQIEVFFVPSGCRLLPKGGSDLEFHCPCPDKAIPCKHLAATAYSLAEKLDLDPWLLFLLRGRSAEEIERELLNIWSRDLKDEKRDLPTSEKKEIRQENTSEQNIDLFWANAFKEPILFPPSDRIVLGLTLDRMALPEPKINAQAWQQTMTEIYNEVSDRANRELS